VKAEGEMGGLTYDAAQGVQLRPGHVLETRTGRAYLVLSARQQKRGKWAGRWHVRFVVLGALPDRPPGLVVHPLVWNARGRLKRDPLNRASNQAELPGPG
jgi:hypothetical protein